MGYRSEGVRLTHLPTGTVATSRDCAPRGNKLRFYHRAALSLLKAKLCRPDVEPIRRTYDLCPPPAFQFDGPITIQAGTGLLVEGNEAVERALDGECPWMERKAVTA